MGLFDNLKKMMQPEPKCEHCGNGHCECKEGEECHCDDKGDGHDCQCANEGCNCGGHQHHHHHGQHGNTTQEQPAITENQPVTPQA